MCSPTLVLFSQPPSQTSRGWRALCREPWAVIFSSPGLTHSICILKVWIGIDVDLWGDPERKVVRVGFLEEACPRLAPLELPFYLGIEHKLCLVCAMAPCSSQA